MRTSSAGRAWAGRAADTGGGKRGRGRAVEAAWRAGEEAGASLGPSVEVACRVLREGTDVCSRPASFCSSSENQRAVVYNVEVSIGVLWVFDEVACAPDVSFCNHL